MLIHGADSFDPYMNIALEESLFLSAIQTRTPMIRLWENTQTCIYLGIGKRIQDEVHLDRCKQDDIPVIRRFSGGGTVLHSQGNLNFCFIFPLEQYPECIGIQESYQYVFKIIQSILDHHPPVKGGRGVRPTFHNNKNAFSSRNVLSDLNPPISPLIRGELRGSSDFCIAGKKFSGNAQARRKNTLLHHGTLMIDNDLSLINRYLKHPSKEPTYRNKREHSTFVTKLTDINPTITKESIIQGFQNYFKDYTEDSPTSKELNKTTELMKTKYTQSTWNQKI